ncbi:MAG: hypothetical protein FWE47_00050 [Oscillospiraceae bacterium]|nr:hypothetical protein [Oscillospiraceae bacterium]
MEKQDLTQAESSTAEMISDEPEFTADEGLSAETGEDSLESPTEQNKGEEPAESPTADEEEETLTSSTGKEVPEARVDEIIRARVNEINRKNAMEKAALERQVSMAHQALGLNPGETIEDRLIEAEAYNRNVLPEVIKAERARQEIYISQQVQNHPVVLEAETLRAEKIANEDFQAIKTAFPDVAASNMDEVLNAIGADKERFFDLRFKAGLSADMAYQVIQTQKARTEKPMPASAGKLKQVANNPDKLLTPDEVRALPDSAYDDPIVFRQVEKSMASWYKK